MKQKEITLNTLLDENRVSLAELSAEEIGDEHAFTSIDTPMREDAFVLSEK